MVLGDFVVRTRIKRKTLVVGLYFNWNTPALHHLLNLRQTPLNIVARQFGLVGSQTLTDSVKQLGQHVCALLASNFVE